ncbi:HAD hydrolase-like protein [Candidatus Saccharibacteria bacterium]|nr:HAD hydrolase-like protein [Candidatus Saccharibacteria bacterium]
MKPLYLAGIPKKKRPLFVPDFTADSILDVNFKVLKKQGIKHLLIDLDLTIRKKMSRKLEPSVINYLNNVMQTYNFKSLNIASNNMLDLSGYGNSIHAKVFQPFWNRFWIIRKPNKFFYQRILKTLNASPSECVMIGDKLRGDVYGGNVSKLTTVWVKPRGRDYWYDKILLTRLREKHTIDRYLTMLKK